MTSIRWVLVILFALAAMLTHPLAGPARAALSDLPPPGAGASAWVATDQSAARLVTATETAGDGATIPAGLHIRLADGWKTYWRTPGDAGFPAQIDWAGSENVAATEMSWPAPHRFSVLGLETLGYEGEVVLPIAVRPVQAGDAVQLRASVNYLTCAEICIPQRADLALDLPAGPPQPSAYAHLIAQHQSRVPGPDAAAGLQVVAAEMAAGGERELVIRARSTAPLAEPDVFIEGPDTLAAGAPQVTLAEDGRGATLAVPIVDGLTSEETLNGHEIVITLVDGDRAVERTLVVGEDDAAATAAAAPASEPVLPRSTIAILALGFLGGLILNLMPCVLPVLSIKLLGVVSHGGGQRRTVRLSFLASAAGILASFLVLAAALASLKTAGLAVGWGLQFQQPWFLIVMTLVVVLFAGNLFGLFEVHLPRAIADAGERAGHVRGLGGHFLTGALATLLATPCSAPFLGTAVGFALARGTGEIFAVLTAVGLGLAAPYLVVAALPALATRLPRPGRWMAVLRRVLGAALVATAVWLLSVLAVQVGPVAAAAVGVLAVAVTGLIGWMLRARQAGTARLAGAAAAVLAAVAFFVPADPARVGATAVGDDLWAPFDEAAIADLVADGHVVFVNVTADWCITCKVNEAVVLSDEDVVERLGSDGVVAMQGDWTRPSEAISRYLASFGRYGIPFDAVYGPALPAGEALPELLTPEMVRAALTKAAGDQRRARLSR